jgi:hypothetical protein
MKGGEEQMQASKQLKKEEKAKAKEQKQASKQLKKEEKAKAKEQKHLEKQARKGKREGLSLRVSLIYHTPSLNTLRKELFLRARYCFFAFSFICSTKSAPDFIICSPAYCTPLLTQISISL